MRYDAFDAKPKLGFASVSAANLTAKRTTHRLHLSSTFATANAIGAKNTVTPPHKTTPPPNQPKPHPPHTDTRWTTLSTTEEKSKSAKNNFTKPQAKHIMPKATHHAEVLPRHTTNIQDTLNVLEVYHHSVDPAPPNMHTCWKKLHPDTSKIEERSTTTPQ